MLNKNDIYQIWAPSESVWSRWVKPVLFAFADAVLHSVPTRVTSIKTDWVPAPRQTAIVVDLPVEDGVYWGIEFAHLGYRPIPLYNALPFPLSQEMLSSPSARPKSTVAVEPILAAICKESSVLKQIALLPGAPPAFLLDAYRRMAQIDLEPDVFDNRSVCFITDFPSAEFLLANGIYQVIVLQQEGVEIQTDLLEPMLAWQKAGIEFFKVTPAGQIAVRSTLRPPSFLKRIWHRFSITLGLRQSQLGGFGGIVPPSAG